MEKEGPIDATVERTAGAKVQVHFLAGHVDMNNMLNHVFKTSSHKLG